MLGKLRDSHNTTPVMLLTAKSEIEDRVAGLNAGADDYLPKPFAASEFIARVKALSRRSLSYTESLISVGNTTLDCNRFELSAGDVSVRLNNKEYQLMELFMKHPPLRIFHRTYYGKNMGTGCGSWYGCGVDLHWLSAEKIETAGNIRGN